MSFGGPSFLFKMIPVRGMSASFLYDQVKEVLLMIQNACDQLVSIICDGNRGNQKFVKMFDTMTNKPWLTTGGVFLLLC